MAYVALYREWRPKTFDDIVGQIHISTTLKNAIEANRVAHAYLFCGPRGTGKTSTAKVLAKALNCLENNSTEPCNHCENCMRVNEGTSYDVIEIDAASNRGIDEIRDLREKVKFAPAEGKYKVYIIDEVHMLTTEAFNALLKTLEEPPKHVVFVLATTEPHKLPLTILSRCQRFDFKRIGLADTMDRLKQIAEHEEIIISADALRIIAKRSEGGMRDALSILDQCISFSGKNVSVEDINTILGAVNEELLQKVSWAIIKKDTTRCLGLVDEILKQGKDARQFIKDLIEYFRNLLLVQVCDNVDGLVNVAENTLAELQQQAGEIKQTVILKIMDLLTDAEKEMKWTTQPRLMLEVGIIKASQTENAIQEAVIISDVKETKKTDVISTPKTAKPPKVKETSSKKGGENADYISKSDDPENTAKVKDSWTEILNGIKKVRMSAYAFLVEGQPLYIKNNSFFIGFKEGYAFHKEKVEQAENKTAVEKVLNQVVGMDLTVKCIFAEETGSAKEEKPPMQEPIVQDAIKIFGGDVIEIND